MESQSLSKLPVSKLKALALFKAISIKGCCEKHEIIAALRAGGVADADAPVAAAPPVAAAAPAASPIAAPPQPIASAGDGGADGGWAFDDKLLPDRERPTKVPRTGPAVWAAGANAAASASADADAEGDGAPAKKGLKFFQLKKGQRADIAKVVAKGWTAPPPPAMEPKAMMPHITRVFIRPSDADLKPLPLAQLREIAKDHEVNIEGCLEKEDVIAALLAKGVKDAKPKPKVIAPPPKRAASAAAAAPAQPMPTSPQEYYAMKNASVNEKWEKTMNLFNEFKHKFVRGDRWEIFAGFPLWAHENSDEKSAYMNAVTHVGRPTVIEIVIVSKTRIRVRAMRFNPMVQQLTGIDPCGWMDISAVVNHETGKLLMRPYDPHGMYVQTATGQEPVLRTRTAVNEKLRVDKDIGAGLHLTSTPAGMQVDDIDALPGQPGLAVGDLIIGIAGINLINLASKEAVEVAFRSNFVDGAELEIAV